MKSRPVFLQALRKVAEAQGMAAVAKRAGIPRESLYRVLSAKGNPRWSTLAPVVRATGLKIEVIQIHPGRFHADPRR